MLPVSPLSQWDVQCDKGLQPHFFYWNTLLTTHVFTVQNNPEQVGQITLFAGRVSLQELIS